MQLLSSTLCSRAQISFRRRHAGPSLTISSLSRVRHTPRRGRDNCNVRRHRDTDADSEIAHADTEIDSHRQSERDKYQSTSHRYQIRYPLVSRSQRIAARSNAAEVEHAVSSVPASTCVRGVAFGLPCTPPHGSTPPAVERPPISVVSPSPAVQQARVAVRTRMQRGGSVRWARHAIFSLVLGQYEFNLFSLLDL